jgi:hypothetical protein
MFEQPTCVGLRVCRSCVEQLGPQVSLLAALAKHARTEALVEEHQKQRETQIVAASWHSKDAPIVLSVRVLCVCVCLRRILFIWIGVKQDVPALDSELLDSGPFECVFASDAALGDYWCVGPIKW